MTGAEDNDDHYAVLGVSRRASLAELRSAYRRLMQSPGNHPDRGGDAATAARLNRAYAVLRDPAARSEYDLRLDILARVTQGIDPSGNVPDEPRPAAAGIACAFCRAPQEDARPPEAATACSTCGSPMMPVSGIRLEPEGQRSVQRVRKRIEVLCYTHWKQEHGYPGHTEDLSLNGLRFVSRLALTAGQDVRLVSDSFDAVGQVIRSRPDSGLLKRQIDTGIAFRTLRFRRSAGSFVSRRI